MDMLKWLLDPENLNFTSMSKFILDFSLDSEFMIAVFLSVICYNRDIKCSKSDKQEASYAA